MKELPIAEIVCLGNELLIGVTINTNATFLGEQLTKLGYIVRRETSIRDDLELAVEFFKEIFERKPDVIVVSGGLGPTYDDIQMEVLAEAIGGKLVEYKQAIEMLEQYYGGKGLELTKERRKMAYFPEGAEILSNQVGGAPGCLIKFNDMEIFCLPGVPPEMKDIFARHIQPYLQKRSEMNISELKFSVLNCVESELAPYINKVKKEFSELYIKSHPWFGQRAGIVIHISGMGENATGRIIDAKNQLQNMIKKNITASKIKDESD